MCGLITSRGELKIGEKAISYFVVAEELLVLTTDGVNNLIDLYFKDLKGIKLPINYYFELGKDKGYFVGVIKFLYSRSGDKDEAFIKRLLTLGLSHILTMVDAKGQFPKGEPELSPAELQKLNEFLLKARNNDN